MNQVQPSANSSIPGKMKLPINLRRVLHGKHSLSHMNFEKNNRDWINIVYELLEREFYQFSYTLNLICERAENKSDLVQLRQEQELERQYRSEELREKINIIKKTNEKLLWHCCYKDNVMASFDKNEDAQLYMTESYIVITVIGPI
jgi:hypothetical protein